MFSFLIGSIVLECITCILLILLIYRLNEAKAYEEHINLSAYKYVDKLIETISKIESILEEQDEP